jgi:hypothetical protein
MKIGPLLNHLKQLEAKLAAELRAAAERHADDHDVYHQCQTFAVASDKRLRKLEPLAERYGGQPTWKSAVGHGTNELLEDLRALYVRAQESATTWVMAAQAAKAARDQELLSLATECHAETDAQAKWFMTRIKTGAPQALLLE